MLKRLFSANAPGKSAINSCRSSQTSFGNCFCDKVVIAPPGSNRISPPCTPLALSFRGANSPSNCSIGRPLTKASAPPRRPSSEASELISPFDTRTESGVGAKSTMVPSTSRNKPTASAPNCAASGSFINMPPGFVIVWRTTQHSLGLNARAKRTVPTLRHFVWLDPGRGLPNARQYRLQLQRARGRRVPAAPGNLLDSCGRRPPVPRSGEFRGRAQPSPHQRAGGSDVDCIGTAALSPSDGLPPTTLARMNSIAIRTGLEGASQYSPRFGMKVRSTAFGSDGRSGKYASWARPHNSRTVSRSSVRAIAPDNEMKVFVDTSPKHRHALGFAAISSGLWVERAVMKKMAFSYGRAMPCIGRARRCGPSQVVIMQVEMRSMFFQMKDNCSASDRFEFEADIFSFIVLPVCEGHPLISHSDQNGGTGATFPPREPLGAGKGGSPEPNRVQKNLSSTCNRFGSVAFFRYGASISPQAMRSDSTAMVPRCRGCFLFSRPPRLTATRRKRPYSTRNAAGRSLADRFRWPSIPLRAWAATEHTPVEEAQISPRSSQFWAPRLFDRRTGPD